MKIEIGKRYVRRDGSVSGVIRENPRQDVLEQDFRLWDGTATYTESGKYYPDTRMADCDLIAEYHEPAPEYRWEWCTTDKPGLWAYGGAKQDNPPMHIGTNARRSPHPDIIPAWRCYLGPIPTILPPLPPKPELKLPEGWHSWSGSDWHTVANATVIDRGAEIRVNHPDESKRIRAVQAALDVLSEEQP